MAPSSSASMETMLDRLRAEAPELLEAVTEEGMTAAEGIVKTASPRTARQAPAWHPRHPTPALIVREPISEREVKRPTITPSGDPA
jgi:1,6-anhydro-N-acetylmuramate kinase